MRDQVEHKCGQCEDSFACPDALIYYDLKFDEYGIIVHDGGESYVTIDFCPFCGSKLPQSKRDLWFERLEALGIDPWDPDARPAEFQTDEWYRQNEQ
ncbi:MAG: hypothetical protein FJ280_15490 [Planctomycetes bacterium]|nr:hypothetical protein [Planctomycetota bacterium]